MPEHAPPPSWTERPLPELREDVGRIARTLFDRRTREAGDQVAKVIERTALLGAVDGAWSWYLDQVADLRQGVFFRSYGQRDPKIEFMRDSAALFDDTIASVRHRAARAILSPQPFAKRGE
jgi:preprotein translocase subunit SecA